MPHNPTYNDRLGAHLGCWGPQPPPIWAVPEATSRAMRCESTVKFARHQPQELDEDEHVGPTYISGQME